MTVRHCEQQGQSTPNLSNNTEEPDGRLLLEGDESRRVCRAKTRLAVSGGDVGDGELGEIVAGHFWLDLDGIEDLSIIDGNDRADHLRDHDHVSEVRLDRGGLLVRGSLCLCLAELLDEAHGSSLESSLEPPANTGGYYLHEVLVGHVEESVELDSSVGELLEGPCPLLLGGGSCVVVIHYW